MAVFLLNWIFGWDRIRRCVECRDRDRVHYTHRSGMSMGVPQKQNSMSKLMQLMIMASESL